MYRRSMTRDELNRMVESAKARSSNSPVGLYGGGFRIIDDQSRSYLNQIVGDIAGARSQNQLKQAYLAYTYLGLSCGISINDILDGMYSNRNKNYALELDPGEWIEEMLDNAGLIIHNNKITSSLQEVKPNMAAKLYIRHKSVGGDYGKLYVTHRSDDSVNFGQDLTDKIEMFLKNNHEDMIGSVNQPKKNDNNQKAEQNLQPTKAGKQVGDIRPKAAANTLAVAGPGLATAAGLRFDPNKFFNGSKRPNMVDVSVPVNQIQDTTKTVEAKPPMTIIQQQVAAARDKIYAGPSEDKWESNPMDAKLLEADDTTKLKVVKNHVKMIEPRDMSEEEFNELIRFLTSDKFKEELTKKKAKCKPDNPHLVEVPLNAYLRPGNEGKYDIAFKVKTETEKDLIILYSIKGTNKRGNKKGKNHNSVFFLN